MWPDHVGFRVLLLSQTAHVPNSMEQAVWPSVGPAVHITGTVARMAKAGVPAIMVSCMQPNMDDHPLPLFPLQGPMRIPTERHTCTFCWFARWMGLLACSSTYRMHESAVSMLDAHVYAT